MGWRCVKAFPTSSYSIQSVDRGYGLSLNHCTIFFTSYNQCDHYFILFLGLHLPSFWERLHDFKSQVTPFQAVFRISWRKWPPKNPAFDFLTIHINFLDDGINLADMRWHSILTCTSTESVGTLGIFSRDQFSKTGDEIWHFSTCIYYLGVSQQKKHETSSTTHPGGIGRIWFSNTTPVWWRSMLRVLNASCLVWRISNPCDVWWWNGIGLITKRGSVGRRLGVAGVPTCVSFVVFFESFFFVYLLSQKPGLYGHSPKPSSGVFRAWEFLPPPFPRVTWSWSNW